MNTKATRVAIWLLAAVTIARFLLLKLNTFNEISTNKHKGSSVLATKDSNNYSDTLLKQDNIAKNIKNTQQKKVQDSTNIYECDNPANPNDLIDKRYSDEELIELANNTEKLSQSRSTEDSRLK